MPLLIIGKSNSNLLRILLSASRKLFAELGQLWACIPDNSISVPFLCAKIFGYQKLKSNVSLIKFFWEI